MRPELGFKPVSMAIAMASLTALLAALAPYPPATFLSPSYALSAAPTGATQVLVLDRLAPPTKTSKAEWQTVWSDGEKTQTVPGIVVNFAGKPSRLDLKTETQRVTCPSGKFPFVYDVDEVTVQPLSGGAEQVLMGADSLASAKDLMKEFLSNCDGIKPVPYASDMTSSYEKTKVNLVSLFGDKLGLEVITQSFSYGRPTPMISVESNMFQLRKADLVRLGPAKLSPATKADAAAAYNKLPQADRDAYSAPDASRVVIAPGNPCAFEFALSGTADISRGTAKTLHVDSAALGGEDEYNKARAAFFAAHGPALAKASFYAVAPNRSACVYAQGGKLYWLPASGGAKLIGSVKDVHGWQWLVK